MNEFERLVRTVDAERTQKQHQATCRRLAETSFADHEITVELMEKDQETGEEYPTRFRCAKPGSGMYAFRVCFLPQGMILVYGDIGEMMLQRGGYGWLKGAIRHDYISDYVMEKVLPRPDQDSKAFMSGDALTELREMHDGIPYVDSKGINLVELARAKGKEPCEDDWERPPESERAIQIAHEWLNYDESGGHGDVWVRANYETAQDFWEGPDCLDYSSNQLWCYCALSWFVRKWEEMK